MGLVHQYYYALSLGGFLCEPALQGLHDDIDALSFQVKAEAVCNGIQQLFARQAGIGQVNVFCLGWQAFQQHAAQHGLAAAYLACDFDDAFALGDSVNQGIENFTTTVAGKEEVSGWSNFERRFVKSKMFQIHYYLSR